MAEYLFEQDQLDQMDNNIRDMLSKGATQEDVMMYANDYKEKFVKKKDGTMGLLSSPSVSIGIDPEELKARYARIGGGTKYINDLIDSKRSKDPAFAPTASEFISGAKKLNEKKLEPERANYIYDFLKKYSDIETNDQTRDAFLSSQYAGAYYSESPDLQKEYQQSDLKDILTPRQFTGLKSLSFGRQSDYLKSINKLKSADVDESEKEATKLELDKFGIDIDQDAAASMFNQNVNPQLVDTIYTRAKTDLPIVQEKLRQIDYENPYTARSFKNIINGAINRGVAMGSTADLLTVTSEQSGIDVERLAAIQRDLQAAKSSKAYEEFSKNPSLETFSRNPIGILTELSLESLAALYSHGSTRMATGGATGAAMGSVVPGIGTAVGLTSGITAGLGLSSLNLEYSSKILEGLNELGVDVTKPDQIKNAFSDVQLMSKLKSDGLKKGVPVALFDMLSAGLAGKIVSKPTKSVVGKLLQGTTEVGVQAGLGGAGEASGQLVSEGKISRPNDIIMEMVGEFGPGSVEIAYGSVVESAKKGSPVKTSDIVNIVTSDKKNIINNNIQSEVVAGTITQEQADVINKEIAKVEASLPKVPEDLSADAKARTIELIDQKTKLTSQLKNLDDAFKPDITNKIKSIDEQIISIAQTDRNATTESQVQEGRTESNISQPQGAVQGQPEIGQGEGQQGQAEIPQADVSDSNISGKREVIKQKFDFVTDQDFVAEAFTPEEDAADRAALPESEFKSEEELSNFLANGEYAMLTGQNPDAVPLSKIANKKLNDRATQWFADRGLKATPIFGKYDNSERSFLVPNMTKAQAIEFAKEFQQDSVAHSSGLVYKDGSFNPRTEGVNLEPRFDKGGDFFSSINIGGKPVDFSINYNFDTTVPAEGMQVDEQGQLIDTKLQDAVGKASQALQKSGIKFNIIDSSVNPEQADAARGNQAIFRDTDGTITIDKSKLANDIEAGIVVWHESSHPVMNIIRNTDRNLYDAVVRGLTSAAQKNEGIQKALDWATDGYEGNDVQADEALVETIARIAEGVVDVSTLDTGLRQRIIDFINDIAKIFGIDPILNDTDLAAFKKTVSEVADALKTGRDIAEVVGEGNVGKFKNELVQQRITAEEVLKKEERGDKKVIEVADAFEKAVDDVLDPQSDPKSRITRFLKNAYEDLRYFLSEYSGDTGLDWYTNKVKEFDAKLKDASDIAINNGEMPEANSLRNPDNMDVFKVVLALSSIGVNPRENVKAAFSIWKTFNQETKTFSKYQPGLVSLRTNIPDGKGGYSAPSGEIIKDTDKYLDLKQKNGKVLRIKKSDLAKEFSVTYKNDKGKEVTKNLRYVRQTKNATVYRSGPSTVVIKNDDILDSSEVSDGIQGKGWTTKGNIVAINLVRLENVLADHSDLNSAIKWINDKHPINELRKYNSGVPDVDGAKGKINPKGERLGSYIIGEKLGAFHQNVAGTPTELTMDLWWSRTWNRYMGTLIGKDKDGEPIIQETPRTDNERNVMREAAKTMADSLGLEVHELQAALWYLEQQVYKRMGAAVESYSFVDGINELLLQYGKSREEIQPERYGIDSSEADQRRTDAAARAADILYGEISGSSQEATTKERRDQPSVGNRDIINGFYSPIEDRINTFKQPKASVQKWKEIVGVKSDEAVFSGLADWLGGMKPDRQLSKEEVLKFIKDNRIEINEIQIVDPSEEDIESFMNDEAGEGYTREEAIEYLRGEEGAVKYSQYQLPGGENYKEVLVTLPGKDQFKSSHFDEPNIITHLRMNTRTDADGKKVLFLEEVQSDWGQKGKREGFERNINEQEQKQIASLEDRKQSILKGLKSYQLLKSLAGEELAKMDGMQEEDKVLGFLDIIEGTISGRIDNPYYDPNDQQDVNRNRKIIVDEVKRDIDYWTRNNDANVKLSDSEILSIIDAYNEDSKAGRVSKNKGYSTNRKVLSSFDEIDNINKQIWKIKNDATKGSTSPAPYVTNTNAWVKLGLKVALKEAIKQGADRIAWTTGDQQNERYDLSKQVDEITYYKYKDGTYQFSGSKNDVQLFNYQRIPKDKIEDYVGKDVAKRMIDNEGEVLSYGNKEENTYNELGRVLKGSNLTVGGKGMKAFYGDAENTGIVGNVAKALVKELTGKEGGIVPIRLSSARNQDVIDRYNRARQYGNVPESLAKEYEQAGGLQSEQPAIDITPELAKSVQQGMPQFSVGNRTEADLRAEGQGKERNRALASKYGDLSPETQTKIDDDAVTYFQRPNKQTEKAVDEFLDGINLIDAADYVLGNPDIPEVSKVWMAATVAKRLNAEIDAAKTDNNQDLVDALTSKQAEIYNEFAKKATSLGQAVQAFIAFKNDPNAVEFFLPKILRQLKKAGVEEVTEVQKADIIQGLKKVNESKPGLPKDKAIIELSHYLAGLAPVKPIDVLQALWYAKILSGITTQATNFFANVFNTMFELPAVGMRIAIKSGDPMAVLYGMKGFGSGVIKGLVEGADIVKSGVRTKEEDKYFAENPLEYFTWSKWLGEKGKVLDKIPPVNFGAWKYIGRILAATDALFSTANQEAVANMLAYADSEGKPSRNKHRQVDEKLNNTKEKAVEAKKQAIREGFKRGSIQWKRRVIELIDQGRDAKVMEEADAIGKRITMNYDPEGWTRPIFDAVVGLQRNIPIIKMVVPFARIVANLTENALNYTPAGAVRAVIGKRSPFNKSGAPLTTDERIDLMSKFAIGMGALAILATKVGDDDDDWFDITGGGPNDTQKKYELQKGGWRAYTIVFKDGTRLNYKDWPMAGILAGMGNIRDSKKYGEADETSMALAAYGFFLNFYDKSLLSGLSDFFGIFNVNAGRGKYAPETKASERATKWAAQQAKSVAVSNLAQQTGKLYSELVTGDPQRDAKTFTEIIYRDLPMFNDGIRPIIDVFGDEVKYTTTERLFPFMDDPEKDSIIKWLNENKLFVGVPKKTNIYEFDTDTERPMTDGEYYEYRKLAGKKTKEWILDFMEDMKGDERQVTEGMFDAAKRAARSEAYAELFVN
jgi:hypothetical protein